MTTPAKLAKALDKPTTSPVVKRPLERGCLGTIISAPGSTRGLFLKNKKRLIVADLPLHKLYRPCSSTHHVHILLLH